MPVNGHTRNVRPQLLFMLLRRSRGHYKNLLRCFSSVELDSLLCFLVLREKRYRTNDAEEDSASSGRPGKVSLRCEATLRSDYLGIKKGGENTAGRGNGMCKGHIARG